MRSYIREAKKARRKKDYLRAGDLFEVAGEFDKALEMFVTGRHFPMAARLMEKIGNMRKAAEFHEKAGNYQRAAEILKAEKDFARAARNYEQTKAYFMAAQMYDQANLPLEAAKMYEKSNHNDKAAEAYLKQRNFKMAAQRFIAYSSQVQNDPELLDKTDKLQYLAKMAGFCYENTKEFQLAAQMYEKGNELSRAAELYKKAGNLDKAGLLYLKLKQYDQAIDALKETKNDDFLNEAHARRYVQESNLEKAGEFFEKAGLMEEAADSYSRANNHQKAAEAYLALQFYYKAGENFLHLGDYQQAADCYERAGDYRYAGELYMKSGNLEKAALLFTRGNHLIKGAELYKELGEFDKAKKVLQQVPSDMADYYHAMALMGAILFEEGNIEGTVELLIPLTQDLGINRDTLALFYYLAIAYDELGEFEKARVIYEGILRENYQYMDVEPRLEMLYKKRESGSDQGANSAFRYTDLEEIGRTDSDVMFKANDTFLNRLVMIRVFGENGERQQFTEDERSAALLSHSNIITLFDSGFTGKNRFVVMEYVDGEVLQRVLSRDDRFTISEIIDIMEQVLDALIYAHNKGVIHKNLQPACIILTPERQVKVTDFGMQVFQPRPIKGERFIAPELLAGRKPSPATDLYSLGLTFYKLLTNRFPSKDDGDKDVSPPSYWNRQVPKFLDNLVLRCIDPDPEKRFQNASELLKELQATDLFPGAVIAGRYEITLEIGAGGMGRVFKAMDIELSEEVALKFLKPLLSSDRSFVERFKQEIRVSRKIVHPNVVKIYDFGEWHGLYYISMEYIHGRNLKEMVKTGRRFKHEIIIRIVKQVLSALDIAHSMGIIHRDIKPQNIMINAQGEIKLLDFGIARGAKLGELTVPGQVIGTPEYISPEQANNKAIDHRSDLYSLGIVMYEMATGKNPFTADSPFAVALKQVREIPPTPRSLNSNIPDALNQFIMKLLQKSPEQRFQSAKAALEALE